MAELFEEEPRTMHGKPFGKLLQRYAAIADERQKTRPGETIEARSFIALCAAVNEYEAETEHRLAELEKARG